MKRKKLFAMILCTTMLFATGTSAVMAQELASEEEGMGDTVVSDIEPLAEAIEDSTIPYDPTVDGEYTFTISASYDATKEYTVGDVVDVTFTIASDAEVPLNLSNAYIWHDGTGGMDGTKELLTDVILLPGQTCEKTIQAEIPWDWEYDDRRVGYSLEFNTLEFSVASGDITIDTIPVSPVIENGEYRFPNAPTRYLITFKLGNGITNYEVIYGGGGDAREVYHADTGITDYYLRPGYLSSFIFNPEDKYADENSETGLKAGYEIVIKLVDGDCTCSRKEYMPQIIGLFDIKKPATFEVSVVEVQTTISDDSGVSMELPENVSENLELVVSVSDGTEEKEAVKEVIMVDGDKIKTFDLSLLKNGEHYTYNGQFKSTVSLPIPQGWDMSQLALYYYDESINKATPVAFNVDKEKSLIVFDTNHFSRYVLAQKTKESDTGTTPDEGDDSDPTVKPGEPVTTPTKPDANNEQKPDTAVDTGDTSNIMLWGVITLIAAFGIVNVKRKRVE